MKPTDDYWLSRRPEYSLERILRIGLHHFRVGNVEQALKVIKIAISYNHADSCWLYERLMEFSGGQDISPHHMFQVMYEYPNHQIIKRYRFDEDRSNCSMQETLEAAATGCDAAQSALGVRFRATDNDEQSAFWHQKAAAQGNAYSCYALSILTRDGQGGLQADPIAAAKLCLKASDLGCDMATLSYDYPPREETELDHARVMVRHYLKYGFNESHKVIKLIGECFNNLMQKGPEMGRSLKILHVIGEELYDYEMYYETPAKDISSMTKTHRATTVGLYLRLTSKARRAAVQTVLVMVSLGVVKDVAKLIAKLVYASRTEATWYNTGE